MENRTRVVIIQMETDRWSGRYSREEKLADSYLNIGFESKGVKYES